MNQYKVLNDRKKGPVLIVITALFGIFLIAAGIVTGTFLGVGIGVIIIWAAFFQKSTVVNEEGIVIHYNARVFQYKEEWPFHEITNLHQETVRDPGYLVLHFTKGSMSKRLVFNRQEALKIVDIALEKNANIYFDEAH